jgi:hypothetical protein
VLVAASMTTMCAVGIVFLRDSCLPGAGNAWPDCVILQDLRKDSLPEKWHTISGLIKWGFVLKK